jgi:hypothetical protein
MVRKKLGKTRFPHVPELGDNRREWRRAAFSSLPMTTEQSQSDTSTREWIPKSWPHPFLQCRVARTAGHSAQFTLAATFACRFSSKNRSTATTHINAA